MKYKNSKSKYKKAYGGLTQEDIDSYGQLSQTSDQLANSVGSMIPMAAPFIQMSNTGADALTGGDYTVDKGDDLGERMAKGAAGNFSHKSLTSNIDEHGFWEGTGRQLLTSSTWGLIDENKVFKNGGYIYANGGKLTEFTEGGTHEQNKLGGIPIGSNASVEEGETMSDNYVFSDRLKVNKKLAEEYGLPKKAIGKSFADVSKMMNDKERPNDPYAKNMLKKETKNLIDAQESYKKVHNIDQPQQQMAMGGPKYTSREEMVRKESFMLPYLAQSMKNLANVGDTSDSVYSMYDSLDSKTKAEYSRRALESYQRGENPMQKNYQLDKGARKYGSKNIYALGGPMHDPDEFNNSGIFNNDTYLPINSLYGNDYQLPITSDPSFGNEYATGQPVLKTGNIDFSNDITQDPSYNQIEQITPPVNKSSDVYGSYLRYAPAVAELGNLAMILANKPEGKDLNMFNTRNKFKANLVNRDQIKRDIESQEGAINRQLVNTSQGNSGALMSNLLGINLNTQKALANANMQSDELDARERARVEEMNYQQNARNQGMRMQVSDMNDRDQGQYSSLLMDSTSNLGQNIGAIGQDERNLQMVNQLPVGYTIDRFGNVYDKQGNLIKNN